MNKSLDLEWLHVSELAIPVLKIHIKKLANRCVAFVVNAFGKTTKCSNLRFNNSTYTTFTNFSMRYLVMCRVYTDVGGIHFLYHVCLPVRKIIHSLKLVDYLHVQADKPMV